MKASLLASESTGGATAREGFGYQDAYVLQSLPRWLAQGAFSHVVSEAVGDVEVCYRGIDGATVRSFIEAKGYTLSLTDFWAEIQQFKKVHETSPAEFPHFVLVCRDFNSNTSPLVTMVSRLRGVGSSYDVASPLLAQTRNEIIQWVVKKGQPRGLAEFIVDRVNFVTYADENAHAAFPGEVEHYLPSINLRARDAAALRDRCTALVTRSARGPVTRREIESAIVDALGVEASQWTSTPTPFFTTGALPPWELGLDADPFNGPTRHLRRSDEWQRLWTQSADVAEFIKLTRPRPSVALSGKQRMSLACVLGYALSATKGFVLDIEHNGQHFRTDEHAHSQEPFFALASTAADNSIKQGAVTIAFPTQAVADTSAMLASSLGPMHCLKLASAKAIDSPAALNKAVAEAKAALVDFRSDKQLEVLHLFIKAPSHFAMALGHRLNAVGRIQLYDWVDGRYAATALLT